MATKDEITLIIAKSLSKQPQALTLKEKKLCCNLTTSKLVIDHGLNEMQSETVMKWCALQKANIAYDSKEDLLGEGLFDFFKKKDANKYNKIIKSYISNAKKNEDDQHISLFLRKLAATSTYIESRGLATIHKKATENRKENIDSLFDRALDISGANDKLSAREQDLQNLKSISSFVKNLHDSISAVRIRKVSSAKKTNEVKLVESKDRAKISGNLDLLRRYTLRNIFRGEANKRRATTALIRTIAKNSNIKNKEQQKELTLAVKDYLGNVHKKLESIYNAEKNDTTNYSL